jgi:hypothetical protein
MSDTPPLVVSPPELPSAQTLVCANCGAPLEGEYCNRCGQRHEPHVHSLTHFAGEAFENITHADSRLWRTLWFLLSKPGVLTREFFAGRRASYLPPFRLYLVISLFFFLVASLPEKFGAQEKSGAAEMPTAERIQGMNDAAKALETELANTPGAAVAASRIRAQAAREQAALDHGGGPIQTDGLQEKNAFTEFCDSFSKPDPNANANYARLHAVCIKTADDHGKTLWEAIAHNIPRAMFVFLPLVALAMKVIYWRPRRYYVEHLLFLVHNHAFVFLALAIVGLLDRIPGLNGHLGLLQFAVGIYIIWYVFRAMRIYYQQSRILTFAKYLTMGFAYIIMTFTVFVLTAVYSALTL